MKNFVEAIELVGNQVTLSIRPPMHPEWKALAAAASVRVLESYPVIERVVLKWESGSFATSRAHVEQLLRPDGFAAVANRSRWQEIVNRLVLDPSGS